jgi:hypothetical protein
MRGQCCCLTAPSPGDCCILFFEEVAHLGGHKMAGVKLLVSVQVF